jgi:hypothetical protein
LPSVFVAVKAQSKKGGFEMLMYLLLAGFIGVGFAVWIGILKLWEFYEERTPPDVQVRLHTTAKNLPRDAFNLVASCALWSGLGALLIRFLLGLVGLDAWLPDTPWALPVVMFFVIGGLMHFWDGPAPSDPIQPRGRSLNPKENKKRTPHASPAAKGAGATRGRTIRSYHDIK